MKTILLVEDDSARLIGLAMILRSCGYAVLEAGNRDEAIHTCLGHSGPIQVLLTDLDKKPPFSRHEHTPRHSQNQSAHPRSAKGGAGVRRHPPKD